MRQQIKRLFVVVLAVALAWTAPAQYQECKRCETKWSKFYVAHVPALEPDCVSVNYVHRAANCVETVDAMSSYEQCSTWTYSACGHTNPFRGDNGPWPLSTGTIPCVIRDIDLDEHCHVSGQCATNQIPPGSPIVINFGNAWRFSGADDPVLFDLMGHGTQELWTWTERGANIAFLAMDRNGDGAITSGRELFGDWTPNPADAGEGNGFEWLKSYDASGDGFVSADDAEWWPKFLLWTDANHDGVSQPSELRRLADSEVWALDVTYRQTARKDGDGNRFLYESTVHMARNGKVKAEKYYDVYFTKVQ